jgi:hypothetical protein
VALIWSNTDIYVNKKNQGNAGTDFTVNATGGATNRDIINLLGE